MCIILYLYLYIYVCNMSKDKGISTIFLPTVAGLLVLLLTMKKH